MGVNILQTSKRQLSLKEYAGIFEKWDTNDAKAEKIIT